MRRLLIWSALAALIGLILAGVGYWAYWNFYSRFQPVTISRDQAQIQQLLDEASWVSGGGGGEPLYIIAYRDSASAQRYEREEVAKLRAAGVEARVILFARADREGLPQSTAAERATIAELWLTRDWSLYQRWTATPASAWTAAGIPAADGNLARSAVVEASRQFETRLGALLKDAGVQITYPLILWRDREGFLKACGCADSRAWVFIRDDLNAPDRVGQSAPVDALPAPEATPGDGTPAAANPSALPYPALPAIPPAAGQTPNTAPNGTPAPASPPAPRAAPEAQKQDDTTFF
ncbi:hypothetical protein GCM10017620_21050 [Brevundimonas intermedia]|uniref:Uncharacterized protein n=1 Tax=Brevundimonas intermedia TaxID=74315 RepID=A0ABQ5T8P6_9CAUL|nr:hypothetical protein [Brevundimonas intermedia]GLK49132.1 hypothetical protein GCM10017620_21050 [Brevundimonas intermedia]